MLIIFTAFSIVYTPNSDSFTNSVYFIQCIIEKTFNHSFSWPLCKLSYNFQDHLILFKIRTPRVIVSILSGMSLAMAGLYSQLIFRNQLASPSIIGSQSGGLLFAVIAFSLNLVQINQFIMPMIIITGVITIHVLVMFLFKILSNGSDLSINKLLIIGFALNILLSGLISLIISMQSHDLSKSVSIMKWLFGSFSLSSRQDVMIIFSTFLIGFFLSLSFQNQLDIYTLGDKHCLSLGISPKKLRNISLIAISVLLSGSLATSGAISFVGLIAPHFARALVGSLHKNVLIISILVGGILTVSCDFLARVIIYPQELEVGIILTIFGGLFFILLLLSLERAKVIKKSF